jgi:hypothetical protein
LQRQYPEMGPLQKVEVEVPPEPERAYMLDLRQTILVILEGERTRVTRPLAHLIEVLVGYYQAGSLVGQLERRGAPSHARCREVEVFASWLKGLLRPASADVEVALQDLVDETSRTAGEALQMLYGLARPKRGQ